jgi:hypothetical protein
MMKRPKVPIVGLAIAVAVLLGDVGLLAQDPDCSKDAFFNTEHEGQREGCGSGDGCHWRECMLDGGGPDPGNYHDECGEDADCTFGSI